MRAAQTPEPLLDLEAYANLPDDPEGPTELVRGRVVREPHPAFGHGRLQMVIARLLHVHIENHRLDLTCVGPVGCILERDPDTVRGPDVALVRPAQARELHRTGWLEGAPALVVEVISPPDRAGEMQQKVEEYLAAGAEEVWVVHPGPRTLLIRRPDGSVRMLGAADRLGGSAVLPELDVPVTGLFGEG